MWGDRDFDDFLAALHEARLALRQGYHPRPFRARLRSEELIREAAAVFGPPAESLIVEVVPGDEDGFIVSFLSPTVGTRGATPKPEQLDRSPDAADVPNLAAERTIRLLSHLARLLPASLQEDVLASGRDVLLDESPSRTRAWLLFLRLAWGMLLVGLQARLDGLRRTLGRS